MNDLNHMTVAHDMLTQQTQEMALYWPDRQTLPDKGCGLGIIQSYKEAWLTFETQLNSYQMLLKPQARRGASLYQDYVQSYIHGDLIHVY